jgi:hypothetical protein
MVMGRLHDYAPKNIAEIAPNGIDYELARLYYDIAGTAYPPAIAALTKLVPVTQILFGSDNPFVPLREAARRMNQLGLQAAERRAIGRDNAVALLPICLVPLEASSNNAMLLGFLLLSLSRLNLAFASNQDLSLRQCGLPAIRMG